MRELLRRRIEAGEAVVVATERGDGDFHPEHVPRPVLSARQRRVNGRNWVMVNEVHGVDVHVAAEHETEPAEWRPLAAPGDVIVAAPGIACAIWAADCAPVVLIGEHGTVVAFHAGWRGLASGIIDVAVDRLGFDEQIVAAVLGPSIHPCCYEFGAEELETVAAGVASTITQITGTTSSGRPALDVPAAVAAGLGRRGVDLDIIGSCTGCTTDFFSHRVRRDHQRHAVAALIVPAAVLTGS